MAAPAPRRSGAPAAAPGAVLVATGFVDCYRSHYGRVVRSLRLAGAGQAEAEDLAQEAFARVLPHWRRVSRGSNPPGYVYRSAFRLLRHSQRRRARPEHRAPPLPAGDVGGDATTSVSVGAALAAMPPRRRQCAVLCLVLGFSPADAGAALGIAAGTVRKHLDEARQDLRAACDPTT